MSTPAPYPTRRFSCSCGNELYVGGLEPQPLIDGFARDHRGPGHEIRERRVVQVTSPPRRRVRAT